MLKYAHRAADPLQKFYTPAQVDSIVRARTEQLEAALSDAQDRYQAISSCLAQMSHEIRTPLNAILGLTTLINQAPELSDKTASQLAEVRQCGEFAVELINNILELSKAKAGKLTLTPRPFNLDDLIDHAATTLKSLSQNQHVTPIIDIKCPSGVRLRGDRVRLEQVVNNLLSNAIKFTEGGRVVFGVELIAETCKTADLRFKVSDTGVGIAAQDLRRLFDPFEQLGNSDQLGNAAGTGLGLAISQQLVNLMGAELTVDSTLNKGTVFSFKIRFLKEQSNVSRDNLGAIGILSSDSNLSAGLSNSLMSAGFEPVCDANPRSLLARLAAQASDRSLVLVDERDMNESRALEPLRTVLMVRSETERFNQAGVDRFEQRVSTALTLGQLLQFAGARRSAPTPNQADSAELAQEKRPLKGISLLIVDDDRMNLEVARGLLELQGAEIETAQDGQQALAQVLGGRRRFDAMLMDICMPVMSGLEITHRIRQQHSGNDLPIIALSAGLVEGQLEAVLKAGMNGFISKPIDLSAATETIKGVLSHANAPRSNTQVEKRWIAQAQAAQSHGALFKPNLAAHRFTNEATLLKHLRAFREELDESIRIIAAPSTDTESLLHRVHRLAGTSGNLAMLKAHNLLIDLHAELFRDRRPDPIQLETLVSVLKETKTEIDAYLERCNRIEPD